MAAKVTMCDRGSRAWASLVILFMPMALSLAVSCAYPSGKGSVEPSLFSHPSGIYDGPFDLVLSAEEGSTIYYTLDGSDPDPVRVDAPVLDPATHAQTFAYSGPIRIERRIVESPSIADIQTTRDVALYDSYPVWKAPAGPIDCGWAVRALALKEGHRTAEGCASYIFERHPGAFTLSLVTPPVGLFDAEDGIYILGPELNAYRLEDKELRAGVEMFDADGRAVSSAMAGVRIGGQMKEQPNKAFDIFYRSEYGASRARMALFPDEPEEEYKRLILRTGGDADYHWSTISDAIAQSCLKLTDSDYQRWRFSILYLNGIYWGFVNLRDKLDDDYVRIKYQLDDESFPRMDFFNNTAYTVGDGKHYDAMMAECAAAAADGLVDDSELADISRSMDIGNYITMVASRIVLGQGYVPNDHNDKRWRVEPGTRANPVADGRWRWMFFDFDNCFYWSPLNDHYPIACESEYGPARYLMLNPVFRERLINRTLDLSYDFFATGFLSEELEKARAMMEGFLPEHIARWGYPESIDAWNERMGRMAKYIADRQAILYDQAAAYFELTGGLSTVEARRSAGAKGCVILFNDDTEVAGRYAYREADSQARRYFNGTSITIEAVAGEGYSFAGWSDGVAEAKRTFAVAGDVALTASFKRE